MTATPATNDRVLTEDLWSQLRRQYEFTPALPAVSDGEQELTYEELYARVARLAYKLQRASVGQGDVVGVAIPRSPALVVAMLAVLRVGAAYVPFDPDDPPGRLNFVAEDADPRLVLTAHLPSELPRPLAALPRLDTTRCAEPEDEAPDLDAVGPDAIDPRSAAYVIYTSGSTGRPKGVVNTHGAIANRLRWMQEYYRVGPGDAILQKTPTGFDVSVWELFLPLVSGALLVFAKPRGHHDPRYLAETIAAEKITIVHFVPSMLATFVEEPSIDRCRSLRQVICSGEALPRHVRQKLQAQLDVPVDNLYGPTEAAVDVSVWPCVEDVGQAWEPIGHAIRDINLHVLDQRLMPTPDGEVGELYIAGVGLAQGYQARPALTAERFVANPYGPAGSRMYRTGDLVRRNQDGRLDYLGRNDDQIKIRGHRIELGEIESVMLRHPSVTQALALVRWRDEDGGRRDGHIAAYFVPAAGDPSSPEMSPDLADHLDEHLPSYMVPATVTALSTLPLNSNGKVDRNALPVVPIESSAPYEPPTSELEQTLCLLVGDVLGLQQVGVGDHFFEIGGTSLDAVRLTHRVQTSIGLTLPLESVFDVRSIGELAGCLREDAIRPPIVRNEPREAEELSFAQQRLWFMYQLDSESASYHIPFRLNVDGDLDVEALEAAFRDVLRRHDVLGSTYPASGGVPFQRVAADLQATFKLGVRTVDDGALEDECVAFASRRFNLSVELPLRAQAWSLSSGRAVLVVVVHHIAADGSSFWPLHADLMTAYRARRRGISPRWSELPVRYADYSAWQRRLFEGDDVEQLATAQRSYWTEKLADMPPELELPVDRPRPATSSYRGGFVEIDVPGDLHESVVALATGARMTAQMVLQAVFAALIAKLSGTTDVRIGVATAGRPDASLEDLVGFFVNTLVMRIDLSGDPSFHEILERTKATNVDAFRYGDLPFEEIVKLVNPPRSSGRHPLVQVMMAEQNAPSELEFDGVHVDVEPIITPAAKFDLSFKVAERFTRDKRPDGIVGGFEYNADLFDRTTVERFARWYVALLRQVVDDRGRRLSQLVVMSEDECGVVLAMGRAGEPCQPDPLHTVADLFELQVERSPDAAALVQGESMVTYRELDAWANGIAWQLVRRGVRAEDRVGLCVDRSPFMVASVLAIWKVGAAYVPFDTDSPPERLEYMLDDSDPTLTVTDARGRSALQEISNLSFVTWDADRPPTLREKPPARRSPNQLAYTIYTSGTTGRPKAVMIEQRSVVRRLHDVIREFGLTPGDVSVQVISVVFEPAVREIFAPLLSGGRVVILDQGPDYGPQAIAAAVCEHKPTVILCIVPSVLDAVMACVTDTSFVDGLRVVGAAGEVLQPDLARRVAMTWRCDVVNQYGPTECTMMTTLVSVTDSDGVTDLPVGVPLCDTSVLVLDEWFRPAPVGVTGEIYIGGSGLARGYFGRPALAASRFVANPFGEPGSRMYRTGDLGRWNAEGCLEYRGRSDTQVKVRGYRVELGEVEAALMRQDDVKQAAVVARKGPAGDVRLAAYVVGNAGCELDGAKVRDVLQAWLPGYMVPYAVVVLDGLPLRGNGKLNHQLLPVPAVDEAPGRWPRTPREEVMCQIFAQALGLPSVSIDSDFFDLGGHSLLAAKLVAAFREALGIDVPIHQLFDAPTVAGLSERLDFPDDTSGLEVTLPLRSGGDLPPLFCIHAGGGLSWSYAGLVRHIPWNRPIYGIQARGLSAPTAMPSSIAEMSADYAAVIRSLQPEGPYHLLGWSFGGLVAHEVAVVFQDRGAQVGLLTLLDAYPEVPDFMRVDLSRIVASLAGADIEPEVLEGMEIDELLDLLGRDGSVFAGLERESVHAIVQTLRHNRDLAAGFSPRPYRGDMVFFTALRDRPADAPVHRTWAPYVTGDILDYSVDSDHMGMTSPDALQVIGPKLAHHLACRDALHEPA